MPSPTKQPKSSAKSKTDLALKQASRKIPKINKSSELHSKFLQRVVLYSIFGIITILLTLLIFYRAKGYTFNKSGQVERRGIVLVDSAPVSAKIFLNDEEVDDTDAKLEVAEGQHTIRLEAEGYRTWQRSFSIEREKVVWLYYPYLIPKVLTPEPFIINQIPKTYSKISPEGRLISTHFSTQASTQNLNLELTNLKETDPAKASSNLVISTLLFSRQTNGKFGQIRFIEWSPNGDSILIEHTYDGKKELVNLRVDNPVESTNLTKQLSSSINEVHYDADSKLYVLVGSELSLYNPKSLAKEQAIAAGVTSFQNFNDSKYIYSTEFETGSNIYIQDGQSKPVKVTTLATKDVSQFDYKYVIDRRVPYLALTDLTSKSLQIFKNPLDISGLVTDTDTIQTNLTPLYMGTFNQLKSPKIENSPGGSAQPGTYIALQLEDNEIFIYDFEEESSFSYSLKSSEDPAKEIKILDINWLDSQRMQAKTEGGDIYYFDYDGNYTNLIGNTTQEFSYFLKSRAATFLVANNESSSNQLNIVKFKK